MKNSKYTSGLKFYKNTDSIDIQNKCIGMDIECSSIPSDVRDHLKRNRGMHVQLRHNGDSQTFAQVNDALNLIAAAPEFLEALEHIKDLIELDNIDRIKVHRLCEEAIAKAKGESCD